MLAIVRSNMPPISNCFLLNVSLYNFVNFIWRSASPFLRFSHLIYPKWVPCDTETRCFLAMPLSKYFINFLNWWSSKFKSGAKFISLTSLSNSFASESEVKAKISSLHSSIVFSSIVLIPIAGFNFTSWHDHLCRFTDFLSSCMFLQSHRHHISMWKHHMIYGCTLIS